MGRPLRAWSRWVAWLCLHIMTMSLAGAWWLVEKEWEPLFHRGENPLAKAIAGSRLKAVTVAPCPAGNQRTLTHFFLHSGRLLLAAFFGHAFPAWVNKMNVTRLICTKYYIIIPKYMLHSMYCYILSRTALCIHTHTRKYSFSFLLAN